MSTNRTVRNNRSKFDGLIMNGFDVVIRCGMRRGIDGKEEIMYLKGYLEIVHRGGRTNMSEIALSTVTLQVTRGVRFKQGLSIDRCFRTNRKSPLSCNLHLA